MARRIFIDRSFRPLRLNGIDHLGGNGHPAPEGNVTGENREIDSTRGKGVLHEGPRRSRKGSETADPEKAHFPFIVQECFAEVESFRALSQDHDPHHRG